MKRPTSLRPVVPLLALLTALHAVAPGADWLNAGELKSAAVFSDHMVLQRDKPVPVWGWADPGARVAVEFVGQRHATTANRDGRWSVTLEPLKASAEPRTLAITAITADAADGAAGRVEVRDVLVGEVWLGSGQSNMAMTVARAKDFETERAAADLPQIRMFKETSAATDSPSADAHGTWTACSPGSVGSFSATLYFFGREIHRELGVPVGLINSSVGGTPIESWIAAQAQAKTPELKAAHSAAAAERAAFDVAAAKAQHEKALARWKEQAADARAKGRPLPRRPVDPVERHERRGGPGGLFNGKIAPLVPYALRGVLWYQGEANSRPERAHLYRHQLPLLVSDWRERWGEELPFAWVQLPNFRRAGEGWMLVREGMLQALHLPKTGMAITVDIGDPGDIHPKNKQEVGRRLALWALGTVYGKKGRATSGPLPAGHEVRGNEIVVTFTHADGGLRAKGGPLAGFEIAGEDRRWRPAVARIEGEMVVVSHPEVKNPVAVRYAWAADPECNLDNAHGLPASPFRTDNWSTPAGSTER